MKAYAYIACLICMIVSCGIKTPELKFKYNVEKTAGEKVQIEKGVRNFLSIVMRKDVDGLLGYIDKKKGMHIGPLIFDRYLYEEGLEKYLDKEKNGFVGNYFFNDDKAKYYYKDIPFYKAIIISDIVNIEIEERKVTISVLIENQQIKGVGMLYSIGLSYDNEVRFNLREIYR